MKIIVELGVAVFLIAYTANRLPKIIKQVRKGQLYLLKESSSTRWGSAWTPKTEN